MICNVRCCHEQKRYAISTQVVGLMADMTLSFDFYTIFPVISAPASSFFRCQ
jgi:hypothetical protein